MWHLFRLLIRIPTVIQVGVQPHTYDRQRRILEILQRKKEKRKGKERKIYEQLSLLIIGAEDDGLLAFSTHLLHHINTTSLATKGRRRRRRRKK